MREKCACFRRRTFTIFKDLLWYVKLAEAMDRRDVVPLREKGGSEATKGGAFPSAVRPVCMFFSSEARFYGFLNDNVIPQSFRKPYNRPDGRGKTSQPRCAREIHPLFGSPPEGEMARWAEQCHAIPLALRKP